MIQSKRLLWLLCLNASFLVRAESSASAPAGLSSADTAIICAEDNATDCYPRLFEPTKDFQVIREGQNIPPGLHVRLNVGTGVKEARLNIPIEGEEAGNLEGIPVEQAMVVVESDEIVSSETSTPQPEEEAIQKALRDHHNKQPPPYEAAGKIQPPPPTGEDIGKFEKAKLTLAMEGRVFDSALDDLRELSHDLYYGLEIAKDGPVLEKLVCLILGSGTEKFHAKDNKRDQKAAAILASAVQNNPTALKEVAAMSRMVFSPTCGTELPAPKINNFVRILRNRLGREKDPATLKSKVAAISGLLKDETIRSSFLESDGMELLLAIWLKKGGQWDTTRAKVADAVMDNFLDEDLGAVLGVWPKEAVEDSTICEERGKMLTDGCWEHHIGSFLKTSPTSSWAEDLLKSLQRERKKLKVEVKHQEL